MDHGSKFCRLILQALNAKLECEVQCLVLYSMYIYQVSDYSCPVSCDIYIKKLARHFSGKKSLCRSLSRPLAEKKH